MKCGTAALDRPSHDARPRVAVKATLKLSLFEATIDCECQHRSDNAIFLTHQAPCFIMKFNEIQCVISDLLTISRPEFATFELDNSDYAITEQNTIHSQTTPSKIKLEKYVTERG